MPWKPTEATKFNKKATTPKSKRAFSKAANSMLQRGASEASAIKVGNAAANKYKSKGKRK